MLEQTHTRTRRPPSLTGIPSWPADDTGGGHKTTATAAAAAAARFNNHNWVEIWDGNGWSFTGAAEYDPAGLNRTWFFPRPAKRAVPGSRLHAIYAAGYARSSKKGAYFPLAWAPHDKGVPARDVTRSYLDANPT
jgi:hypothetical protein